MVIAAPKRFGRLRAHGPLVGILILAAILRLYGLDWGIASLQDFRLDGRRLSFAESGFHPDSNVLERATASLDSTLYPTVERNGTAYLFSSYGPVFMYLHWTAAHLAGPLFGFIPFDKSSPRNADATRLVGRVVSALAALLAVWLTWLLGAACFGRRAGLLAAFLLAVTPMAIQAAHMATVDGLLSVGAAWVCLQAVHILRRGRTRDSLWAGIASGVAVATKLNGAVLLFAPCLAHLLRVLRAGTPAGLFARLRAAVADRRLWIVPAAAVGTYAVLTPAALFRFRGYFLTEFYGNIIHDVWVNIVPLTGESNPSIQRGSYYLWGAPTYLYHLAHVFPGGLGWPLEITVVFGCLYAFYRHTPEDLVLAGTALVYFLIVARFYDKPIRYFVVMGPLFALLSARWLADGLGHARRAVRTAAVAAVVLLCGYTAAYAAAFDSIYTMPDSRVEAAQWVQNHVPRGSKILLERGYNNFALLLSPKRYRLSTMDIEEEAFATRNKSLARHGDYLACLETDDLAPADVLVISDDRIPLSRVSQVAKQYYRNLFAGKLGFELAARFRMRPHLFGLPFDDHDTDLNIRRYDHPEAFVFLRTGTPRWYAERPDLAVYRLRSWTDCRAVFNRAVRAKDFTLFQHCLTRKAIEGLTKDMQRHLFRQVLSQPETIRAVQLPAAFVREDSTWRVNFQVEYQ